MPINQFEIPSEYKQIFPSSVNFKPESCNEEDNQVLIAL
jgi:hypothetical protein